MVNRVKILALGKGNNIAPSAIEPLGQNSNPLGAPDLAAYPGLQGLMTKQKGLGQPNFRRKEIP